MQARRGMKRYFSKTAAVGKVYAKTVNGKLLYAHKVNSNTAEGLDSWLEYESIERAAAALGVPIPENVGCRIVDREHQPIDWSRFEGGYYVPFSTLTERV